MIARAIGGDLTLRRVSSNFTIFKNRIHHPRPFCFHQKLQANRMADEATKLKSEGEIQRQPIESKLEGSKKEDSEKKESKEIPQPPEKPLPGDCCGSGCVRCVWDVYYEELEDYNKLYQPDSKPES
ncbi:UPF0651 protein, mitochondrial [Quillaja saponaria]|uniref:UPF0651 protein, mitochondrial n=1 Tax=Quillaja saponaria TaxID=32244 RepID=A0AAD7M200_QUISA|nr:UPF0651 protein, mitochondrial [Quillaja saponaria]